MRFLLLGLLCLSGLSCLVAAGPHLQADKLLKAMRDVKRSAHEILYDGKSQMKSRDAHQAFPFAAAAKTARDITRDVYRAGHAPNHAKIARAMSSEKEGNIPLAGVYEAAKNIRRDAHQSAAFQRSLNAVKKSPLRKSVKTPFHGEKYFSAKRQAWKNDVKERRQTDSADIECSIGGPTNSLLNFWSGAWLNIFSDQVLSCEGDVVQWEYYAQQAGTFYADVWRPLSGDEFQLIGSNIVTATEAGHQVYDVSLDDRISVQSGDVIGVHYPDETDDFIGGVITIEDSRRDPTSGVSPGDLSRVFNSGIKHSALTVGMQVSGLLDSIKRLPGLKAHVSVPVVDVIMTLGYGADPQNETDEWKHATFITDPSQSVTQNGHVIGWNLFVDDPKPIALQIWRPVSEERYQSIGETWVYPEKRGAMHINLGEYRKIAVRVGDTLGFYFPEGAVIPYDSYVPCNEFNVYRYYRPYGFSEGDADEERVELGDAIQFEAAAVEDGACRRYSFSAEILLGEVPGVGPTAGPTGGPGGDCGVPAIPPNINNRIVGGVPAIPHSWPWMVSLQTSSGFHFCGGSLVAPQWVVTAAHCMPFDSGNRVVVGRHSVSHTSGVEYSVSAVHYTYENYDSYQNDADIALLKLERPIDFIDEVSPVCLPEQGSGFDEGEMCVTTGWGDTSFWGSSPEVLLQVEVPLVSHEQCNAADWYDNEITENMVCAGFEEGGKDSCQGDSGGPLVCQRNGRWELVGIVSWGYGCADVRKPGVYAYTANFVDWIHEKMQSES